MFDPVHDYYLPFEWWCRRAKWFRVVTAAVVLVLGALLCRGSFRAGAIIVVLGGLMLVHGIVAEPERGPE